MRQVFLYQGSGKFFNFFSEFTGDAHRGYLGKSAGLNEFMKEFVISLDHGNSFRVAEDGHDVFFAEFPDEVFNLRKKKIIGQFQEHVSKRHGGVAGCSGGKISALNEALVIAFFDLKLDHQGLQKQFLRRGRWLRISGLKSIVRAGGMVLRLARQGRERGWGGQGAGSGSEEQVVEFGDFG